MFKAVEIFNLSETSEAGRFVDFGCFLGKNNIEFKTESYWCPSAKSYITLIIFDEKEYIDALGSERV